MRSVVESMHVPTGVMRKPLRRADEWGGVDMARQPPSHALTRMDVFMTTATLGDKSSVGKAVDNFVLGSERLRMRRNKTRDLGLS